MSLVEFLEKIDLLDKNLVLGHAVYLNSRDISLLADKNVSVTHHPSCNLLTRNGIAPLIPMLQAGVNVALGIDDKGINDDSDPIMEMRMMYFLHRVSGFNLSNTPSLSSEKVVEICTKNGSSVSGFDDTIGSLEVGKKADIILIDLDEIENDPWSDPDMDIVDLFVLRGLGRHVNTVVIDGKVVMQDREILTIDVEDLYEEIVAQAKLGRTEEQKEYAKLFEKIKPYYKNWYNSWLEDLALDPFYIMNSKI